MPDGVIIRDTIYALASGAGTAGVAVVRISGPGADLCLREFGIADLPEPRYAALHNLHDPSGERIDRALVLRFPGPASFTGEDVVELHVHGGRAVLSAVFEVLSGIAGVRMAEAGEYTRRAFENGKLDLTAAEALADLVSARTPEQRRLALRHYDGGLSDLYEAWRTRLIELMAYAEAEIDFSDEELPPELHDRVVRQLEEIKQEVREHSHTALLGENIRVGLPVTILGAPNVGKSSLLNALSRRDAAIVSAQSGTTRDVVEVEMNLGGFAVVLQDTAGLHTAENEIEREGMRRAIERAGQAPLKLVVIDASRNVIPEEVYPFLEGSIVVANKQDLVGDGSVEADVRIDHRVSAVHGDGLEELLSDLTWRVSRILEYGESPVPTRQRHRDALAETVSALERVSGSAMPELAAEDIRLAVRALGRIVGRVDIDEMLDAVFRDFCIGK